MHTFRSLLLAQVILIASPVHAFEWTCSRTSEPLGACGLVDCDDDVVSTGDALLVLRSAIDRTWCEPCRCDADGSGVVRATDALAILRKSVGFDGPLSCPSCNGLEIVASQTTRDLSNTSFDLAATGDGGVVVAHGWSDRIFIQRLDPALVPTGLTNELEAPGIRYSAPALCARADGSLAVGWSAYADTNLPLPHDYDDPVNVRFASIDAAGNPTDIIVADPPVNGVQDIHGVLCRPSGETAVLWGSRAQGWREWSAGSFLEYPVSDAPADGIHMQRFDAAGHPAGKSKTILDSPNWTEPVDAGSGRILLTRRAHVLLLSGAGSVISDAQVMSPSPASMPYDCSPGVDRCVGLTSGSAVAWVFDPLAPASSKSVMVHEQEVSFVSPNFQFRWSDEPRVACDRDGICIVSWNLMQEVISPDLESTGPESIGFFGRALHLGTGEIGPEVPLASNRIERVASGRFVNVEDSGRRFALRLLRVE